MRHRSTLPTAAAAVRAYGPPNVHSLADAADKWRQAQATLATATAECAEADAALRKNPAAYPLPVAVGFAVALAKSRIAAAAAYTVLLREQVRAGAPVAVGAKGRPVVRSAGRVAA